MRIPYPRQLSRLLTVALLLSLLSSCASTHRVALDPALRSTLSSVAIVQHKDPERFYVMGADSVPGGFLLYMFGAVGGAVLGGAMAAKAEAQADALTQSLAPHQPKLATAMVETLKAELEKNGVRTVIIPPPALDPESKRPRYDNLNVDAQVILEPTLGFVGYRLVDKALRPMIATRVRLLDPRSQSEKFADVFTYGSWFNDKSIPTNFVSAHSYPELSKLYADGLGATAALTEGAHELGRTVARTVKP